MTTTQIRDIIPSLVTIVDKYATKVTPRYVPTARRVIDVLIGEAEGEPITCSVPDDLTEAVCAELMEHTDLELGSDSWLTLLYDLADDMDEIEAQLND